jgi:ribonuclease D
MTHPAPPPEAAGSGIAPVLSLWISTAETLASLARRLARARILAVDTEADSLHHYPGKLCLVQIASEAGEAHLVDPLAVPDLSPLAPLFADPGIVKVLHAADNDLGYLKGLYGFTVANLFDTAVAARFLGARALGLDELLRQHLAVEPGRSRQKDDWSRRPLTAEQEAYAVNDVRHLVALRDRLVEALTAAGRLGWVEEECAALAALPPPDRTPDPDAYLGLKGSRELDPRGLAVLRELYRMRERLALERDRPPFMVLSHEALVHLAARRPADEAALAAVPGMTPRLLRRVSDAVLEAVARGLALSEEALPVRPRPVRPAVPAAVRRRVDALKAWRRTAAERLGLDPGLLLPQRLIERLAAERPGDLGALLQVEGMRRWRAALVGAELLTVLERH